MCLAGIPAGFRRSWPSGLPASQGLGLCLDSPVLDTQGCCNKVPHTVWFKATEVYSFTVLEAGRLKSRCWQGHSPSETSRGGPLLASSSFRCCPQSLVSLGPLACRRISPVPAPMDILPSPPPRVYVSPLLTGILSHWIKGPPYSSIISFYLIKSAMTLFLNKGAF